MINFIGMRTRKKWKRNLIAGTRKTPNEMRECTKNWLTSKYAINEQMNLDLTNELLRAKHRQTDAASQIR